MASIYDSIGGSEAVASTVDFFYVKVLADPSLANIFKDVDMNKLKTHQRAFITAALGGPAIYAGRDMGAAHAGLNITPAQFDTVVGHLTSTLRNMGVPEDAIGEIGMILLPLEIKIVGV